MSPQPSVSASPVLQLIACGSPLAGGIGELLRPAVAAGWDVWVVATPHGRRFVDVAEAERLSGHPVASHYREPSDPVDLPFADAIAVVPATCNTVNKWVAGISDTLALGLLVEAYGRNCPIVAVPYSNRAHAAHPAVVRGVEQLRQWGVTVLFGDDFYRLHQPGEGVDSLEAFPWQRVWSAIDDLRPVVSRR
jgi:phosphopantothenoylcysteine decarboxylase